MSVVYFVKHKGQDPIKIGYTSNLKNRMGDLAVSSPHGLDLVGVIKSPEAKELESKIHKRLDAHRLRGEWFNISVQEAKDITTEFDEDYKSELKILHNLLQEKNISITEVRKIITSHLGDEGKIDIFKDMKDNVKLFISKSENILPNYKLEGGYIWQGLILEYIQQIKKCSRATAYRHWHKIESDFAIIKKHRSQYVGVLK